MEVLFLNMFCVSGFQKTCRYGASSVSTTMESATATASMVPEARETWRGEATGIRRRGKGWVLGIVVGVVVLVMEL